MNYLVTHNVFLRTLSNGHKAYYVRFVDPDFGGVCVRSIDSLRRKMAIPLERDSKGLPVPISKGFAYRIAREAINQGLYTKENTSPYAIDFFRDFWDFNTSAYVKEKNADRPGSVHREYCQTMLSSFTNHAEPLLSENLRLCEITTKHLEGIKKTLQSKGQISTSSIKNVLTSMNVPLGYAYKKELIRNNISNKVTVTYCKGERGVFTEDQVKALLDMFNYMAVQGNVNGERLFIATALSASTGMREGEILALTVDQINIPENEECAIICVDKNYSRLSGLKEPKGKKNRLVPCDKKLAECILTFAKKNPENNGIVLWDEKTHNHMLQNKFYKMFCRYSLKALGITDVEREKAKLTFHSLRHYFVSFTKPLVPQSVLGFIVGHENERTTEIYTHQNLKSVYAMYSASKEILKDVI